LSMGGILRCQRAEDVASRDGARVISISLLFYELTPRRWQNKSARELWGTEFGSGHHKGRINDAFLGNSGRTKECR
jgi:hypothetical protein